MTQKKIIHKLRTAFKSNSVKEQILNKKWLNKNRESGIDSTGFCYHASAVIYLITGEKEKWIIMTISKKDWEHGGHYYLIDRETGMKLDITADQYTVKIPYNKFGKPTSGFRNVKRAKELAKLSGLGEI